MIHVDNTSRVQTITETQHPYLYDLLGRMETKNKLPVLLNTSFNIRGKAILNSVSEALEALKTTELDAVLIEGRKFIQKCDLL